jgi:hypothetical protein
MSYDVTNTVTSSLAPQALHHKMSEKQKWQEVFKETEGLCDLHGDAICNFRKCRESNNRLSIFSIRLEEMECSRIADRVMDTLGCCSPRIASHCENARVVKSILERAKDRVRERLSE